jgi:hypothetical protein
MLKIPIHAHGFSTSTYTPMECLNIDFIGSFPDGGYVLVINDTVLIPFFNVCPILFVTAGYKIRSHK